MKIIFFANGAFSLPSLQSLIDFNFDVLAVVTNNDKIGGRGKKKLETDVSIFAKRSNLNCLKVDDLNTTNFLNKIKSFKAELFIVISYKILPKEIFSIPKYGTVNIHASLLPNYRGAAPIQRSLINGDKKLGLTSFLITTKIDAGKIIDNLTFNINDKITYGESHDILAEKSGSFILDTIQKLKSEVYLRPSNRKVTQANKILKSEYRISLDNSSFVVHNQFRGLTPPGPHLLFNNRRVKLFETYYINKNSFNIEKGSWLIENDKLYIACASGILTAKMIQFAGKNIITTKDFSNMNHNSQSKFN